MGEIIRVKTKCGDIFEFDSDLHAYNYSDGEVTLYYLPAQGGRKMAAIFSEVSYVMVTEAHEVNRTDRMNEETKEKT